MQQQLASLDAVIGQVKDAATAMKTRIQGVIDSLAGKSSDDTDLTSEINDLSAVRDSLTGFNPTPTPVATGTDTTGSGTSTDTTGSGTSTDTTGGAGNGSDSDAPPTAA